MITVMGPLSTTLVSENYFLYLPFSLYINCHGQE